MTSPISPQAVNIVSSPVMPAAKRDLGVNLHGFPPFLNTPSAPLRLRANELFYAKSAKIFKGAVWDMHFVLERDDILKIFVFFA